MIHEKWKKKLVTCVKKEALILKLILKAQKRMKNVLLLFKKNLTNNNIFFSLGSACLYFQSVLSL